MNKPKIKLPLRFLPEDDSDHSRIIDADGFFVGFASECAGTFQTIERINSLAPFLCVPIETHGQKPDLSGVKTKMLVYWTKDQCLTICNAFANGSLFPWSNVIAYAPIPDYEPTPDPFEEAFAEEMRLDNPNAQKAGEVTKAIMRRMFDKGRAFEAGRNAK